MPSNTETGRSYQTKGAFTLRTTSYVVVLIEHVQSICRIHTTRDVVRRRTSWNAERCRTTTYDVVPPCASDVVRSVTPSITPMQVLTLTSLTVRLTLSERRIPRDRAISDACQISFSSMLLAGDSDRKTNRVGIATSVRSPITVPSWRRQNIITRSVRNSTWPIRMLAASVFLGSFFASRVFGWKQRKHHSK